jgi:hypothetical protein
VKPHLPLWPVLHFKGSFENLISKGGVSKALPFLSWRHYIDTMRDYCLELSKIEILKMLDLQKKTAIKLC